MCIALGCDAAWEAFNDWRKLNDENKTQKILSDKVTQICRNRLHPGAGIDLRAVNFPGDTEYWYLYPGDCDKIGTGISIHLDNPGAMQQ